jgi:hypothetical protein
MKLTEWYSGDQKPVRRGVYRRDFLDGNWYSPFNLDFWGPLCDLPDVAAEFYNCKSEFQHLPWRGIEK